MKRPLNRSANPTPAQSPTSGGLDAEPILDLSRNEGMLLPEDIFQVFQSLGAEVVRDYPDTSGLEADYAEVVGVDPTCVLATCGGDEAIDRTLRYRFAGKADGGEQGELVVVTPTFGMIPAFAALYGAKLVTFQYDWDSSPVDRLLEALTPNTKVLAVVTPDNPTGRVIPPSELRRLLDQVPEDVLVLVDLAYVEFADEDPTSWLMNWSNVVMIRTLSKAWGMAGLRIGFAVAQPDLIQALRDVGGPYPIPGPSLGIARSGLKNRRVDRDDYVSQNRAFRARLTDLLEAAGAKVEPSGANFVFARFDQAEWTRQGLAAQGVVTRWFEGTPEYLRITVPRTEQEFARFETALKALSSPETVLFDMDGVLADVSRSYRSAILQTCQEFGVSVTGKDISEAKAQGDANDDWALTWSLIEQRVDTPPSLEEVTSVFEELYQGTSGQSGLRRFETLILDLDLLDRLAQGRPLGIVTGRPRSDAERFLNEQGIADFFSVVVCREDGPLKPDPGPVQKALRLLGAQTAWMLGDTPDDVIAGRDAAVIPVGVRAPGSPLTDADVLTTHGAARVVDASADLGGLFDGLV